MLRTTRGWGTALLLGPLLFQVIAVSPARAQSGAQSGGAPSVAAGDIATANVLFKQGQALMAEKKFADACPKFEEAQRLSPGIGTQFNLADCYEHIGRTASAWATFSKVADLSRLQGKPQHESVARARAEKLQAHLTTLTIAAPASPPPGLEVTRDAIVVGRPQWGTAVPVDPGTYTIRAAAPGRAPWSAVTVVAPDAAAITVKIPDLEPQRAPDATAIGATAADSSGPAAASSGAARGSGQRVGAWIVGGAGLAAIGTGVALAFAAKASYDDTGDHCRGTYCDDEGRRIRNDARDQGNVATILAAAGGAALVAGATLWLTAPSRSSVRVGVGVTPGGGVLVSGGF
jgi:hypothetical protein